MSYHYPPPRARRSQYFLAGLASGVFVMSAVMLLLALAMPRHDLPTFHELAMICQPAGTPFYSSEPMIPARLETTIFCTGATK